jgi:hypothetical protein
MSTDRAPCSELREAAALLRARAGEATPGPWKARFTDRYGFPFDGEPGDPDEEDSAGTFTLVAGTALPREDDRDPGHYEVHHMLAEHDDDLPLEQSRELLASLRWAATVHPGLAEPLAAWLEREARVVGKRHPSDSNLTEWTR